MKHLGGLLIGSLVLALVAGGCKKDKGGEAAPGSAATGSAADPGSAAAGSAADPGSAAAGSAAAAVPDVDCRTASNAYAKLMAATPGNDLSNAKPDDGLISWTGLSMRDYCDEDGWPADTRACLSTATTGDAAMACWKTEAERERIKFGLNEVVTDAARRKAANEAAAAGGSGSAAAPGSATP